MLFRSLVISGAGADRLTWERIPYLFRTTITTWQLCTPMGQWMYDNVAKEVILTGSDYVAGRDTIREFAIAFQAKGGKVVQEIYPPVGTTDYSVYLTAIAASGAPASFNFYTAADAVRFVKQYSELGVRDKVKLTGFAALVDGNRAPKLACKVETLVDGDALSLSIAAASVIAKVLRDRAMADLAKRYDRYGWDRNAGYGTEEHRRALERHGVTPHHRRSFAPVRALLGG